MYPYAAAQEQRAGAAFGGGHIYWARRQAACDAFSLIGGLVETASSQKATGAYGQSMPMRPHREGDAAFNRRSVDLLRLLNVRCQAEICAERFRSAEAAGVVDRGNLGEGDHWPTPGSTELGSVNGIALENGLRAAHAVSRSPGRGLFA